MIYYSTKLQELYNERGILLKFLPPYSPDDNPIEVIFKDLKAWLKRNYSLAGEADSFREFLDFAIGQLNGRSMRV
jgi:transposase